MSHQRRQQRKQESHSADTGGVNPESTSTSSGGSVDELNGTNSESSSSKLNEEGEEEVEGEKVGEEERRKLRRRLLSTSSSSLSSSSTSTSTSSSARSSSSVASLPPFPSTLVATSRGSIRGSGSKVTSQASQGNNNNKRSRRTVEAWAVAAAAGVDGAWQGREFTPTSLVFSENGAPSSPSAAAAVGSGHGNDGGDVMISSGSTESMVVMATTAASLSSSSGGGSGGGVGGSQVYDWRRGLDPESFKRTMQHCAPVVAALRYPTYRWQSAAPKDATLSSSSLSLDQAISKHHLHYGVASTAAAISADTSTHGKNQQSSSHSGGHGSSGRSLLALTTYGLAGQSSSGGNKLDGNNNRTASSLSPASLLLERYRRTRAGNANGVGSGGAGGKSGVGSGSSTEGGECGKLWLPMHQVNRPQ